MFQENTRVSCDFVFSIKIEVGGGGPSYIDEFKLKKHCEIVIRSLWQGKQRVPDLVIPPSVKDIHVKHAYRQLETLAEYKFFLINLPSEVKKSMLDLMP